MPSPAERTLRELRKRGYLVQVVERWNPFGKVRQDLFGIVDVLAVRDGETLAVQATSGSNLAKRARKLETSDALPVLKAAGWRVEVWGWQKSRRTGRWMLRTRTL